MSSFRIERQYVSFETIETPNVHPVEAARRGKNGALSGEADGGDCGAAADGTGAELIERAKKEAEAVAERILRQAEQTAEETLAAAKTRADGVIEAAEKSAEDIKEAARAQGLAQGGKEAEAAAEARKSSEAQELQKLVLKLRNDYSGLVDGMKDEAVALIIEITRKIINVKLKESDQVFIDLVNGAIDGMKQAGYLVIRVSPADYARYFGDDAPEAAINAGEAKVAVVEEESFSPGDLVIESEGEMLNLGVDRQIGQIEAALSGKES